MQTVAAPASVRLQAFGVCRAHGFGLLSNERTLSEAGDAVCALLVDLERTFRIDLDVDEIWRDARIVDLVALVERKVSDKARRALMPANDDIPGQPAPFIRRGPIVAPIAHAVRARRMAARAFGRRRDREAAVTFCVMVGVVCVLGYGCLVAGEALSRWIGA